MQCVPLMPGATFFTRATTPERFPVMDAAPSVHMPMQRSHDRPDCEKKLSSALKTSSPVVLEAWKALRSKTKNLLSFLPPNNNVRTPAIATGWQCRCFHRAVLQNILASICLLIELLWGIIDDLKTAVCFKYSSFFLWKNMFGFPVKSGCCFFKCLSSLVGFRASLDRILLQIKHCGLCGSEALSTKPYLT